MYKKELIANASLKAELTQEVTDKAFSAILETISESLEKEESVVLIGFGTFSITHTKERNGINPITKQPVIIPASKRIKFKASKKNKKQ